MLFRRYMLSALAAVVLMPALPREAPVPSAVLQAQQPHQPARLTAEDYARAERFLGANVNALVTGTAGPVNWLPDGRFWYRATTPAGAEFIMVDPARRTRARLFDQPRLAQALGAATGGQLDPDRLPFGTLDLSRDGRSVTVAVTGRRWQCDLAAYRCVAAEPQQGAFPHAAPPASVASPDGRYAAFIREYNLWVRDLGTGQDRQLTTDGIRDFAYAVNNAGWTQGPVPLVSWSPDSRRMFTFQQDARGIGNMYLVTTNVGTPQLQQWRYPLPADTVPFRLHRVIVDVETARVTRLQMQPDPQRSTIYDHIAIGNRLVDVEWMPDASQVAFVSTSRDAREVAFRVADANTGAVRTLFTETSPTQFQGGFVATGRENWRLVPGANAVLWWSQRDNWGHLYLYDLRTGALQRQVTSGSWNVADVVHIDERGRQVYFIGVGREQGRHPYFQHFYRVGLDGRNVTLLTPEDANHTVSMSPDRQSFVNTYSTPTQPPVSVLRRVNGQVAVNLERADVSRLTAAGWRPPTPVRVKARDGATDIYGLMFTPTQMDTTRRYPIVNYVYPGPWGNSVASFGFAAAHRDHQALAELGFVVVAINGMGTELRSKEFLDFYYGNMGDNTIPDQVAGMRELAQRHRWIDIDRAGIWGHSGGGFATAAAMFRHPDFFKVGVSQAGNHDNRNYVDSWSERFQGLLVRANGGDNYEVQANQLVAQNLRGKLLLAHGAMDDNVAPYNTYLVVDALIKANRDFDLIVFPHARHGFGADDGYMMRRRWDYFVRHLLGAETPAQFRIGG
jgi:dipeptidyl-peptidase 4